MLPLRSQVTRFLLASSLDKTIQIKPKSEPIFFPSSFTLSTFIFKQQIHVPFYQRKSFEKLEKTNEGKDFNASGSSKHIRIAEKNYQGPV